PASLERQWASSAPAVNVRPGFSVTNALGTSPHFSSGIATTAASSTAGWLTTACSTSMGRDVLAARDDDVLLAVAQLDRAVRVHHAHVAAVEPTARKCRLCRLLVAEVPLHHHVAAHHHLPKGLSVGRNIAHLVVDHPNLAGEQVGHALTGTHP